MIDFSELENYLQAKIFPDLERGRPNWDVPHTKAVVIHIKNLVKSEAKLNLDPLVMVIVAYAHDWGYADLFKNGKELDYKGVAKQKSLHMGISAQKLEALLKDKIFDDLADRQKQRVVEIVAKHDQLESLHETDELVFMEADTLAGLDVDKVTPTFNHESNDKYMKFVRSSRFPLFITGTGKKEFERLYKLRTKYFSDLN
jgi:nitrogen fixation protein